MQTRLSRIAHRLLPAAWQRLHAAALLGLLASLFAIGPAQANLLISPTRALLSAEQNVFQVSLRNTGEARRTYRMEWREMRRDDAGNYLRIEAPVASDRIASPMLRYSPRQISLDGGETQTIRIHYQPRADLAAGEYRSHLRFATVGDAAEAVDTEAARDEQKASASVRIGIAFSIPVIVRVGQPDDLAVSLGRVQPHIEQGNDGRQRLALDISVERSGQYSSFGDLNVSMQRDANSPVEIVGRSTDFTVFADASRRQITLPLRDDLHIPAGAWLRVSYDGKAEYAGRVLAEQVFQIQ